MEQSIPNYFDHRRAEHMLGSEQKPRSKDRRQLPPLQPV